mmetsp:Transcript_5051/g.17634  ORF Transcript_5051/g.17634 Transcript_5051/m.17634 type:complete len:208 (+) Transcript_5051:599-1222(+)
MALLPLVVDMNAFFRNGPLSACFPFPAGGLAATMAAVNADTFSRIIFGSKFTLPMPAFTYAALSCLNLISPWRARSTAAAGSSVRVPNFGFGIRPFGPRMRATLLSCGIIAAVAMSRSKLIAAAPRFTMSSIMSVSPTTCAPAARARSACSPVASTATRTTLPVPCGSAAMPRTSWSDRLGSTPRAMDSSTPCTYFLFSFLASAMSV